jgi:hypothetical protein
MSPDSELRVAKPVGIPVSFQRFPIGPEWTRDRAAGEIAVRVGTLLTPCGFCGRKQTNAARNELSPIEASASTIHFQTTPFSERFSLLRPLQTTHPRIRTATRLVGSRIS